MNDGIGERYIIVVQTLRFFAEENGKACLLGLMFGHVGGGGAGSHYIGCHVSRPRGAGIDHLAIGNRFRRGVIKTHMIDNLNRARRCSDSKSVWPGIAGPNQTHIGEPAIQHRPCRHADVFTELGLDQDNHRATALPGR